MHWRNTFEMKIFIIFTLLTSIYSDYGKEDSALKERHALALKLTKLAIKEYKELHEVGLDGFEKEEPIEMLATLKKQIEDYQLGSSHWFYGQFPYGFVGMLEYFGLEDR